MHPSFIGADYCRGCMGWLGVGIAVGDSVDRLVGLSGAGVSLPQASTRTMAHTDAVISNRLTMSPPPPRLWLDCRFKPVAYLFRRVGDTGYALYGGDADFD